MTANKLVKKYSSVAEINKKQCHIFGCEYISGPFFWLLHNQCQWNILLITNYFKGRHFLSQATFSSSILQTGCGEKTAAKT